MAVFTTVAHADLSAWLKHYNVGELLHFEGIASGIENTNYFVTTDKGQFVLTLFEKLTSSEVDYYLHFMAYVSDHHLPCPKPQINVQGELQVQLCNKPATLVTRLSGKSIMTPSVTECAAMGELLAKLHLVGQHYPVVHHNPRGRSWWQLTAPQVIPFIDPNQQDTLTQELTYLLSRSWDSLPKGTVHADLFRDNVLFNNHQISGIIDFYFAGQEALLFDLCVVINDWCMNHDATLDSERYRTLLQAYHQVRALNEEEIIELPIMLRSAAMRFWLSRLFDKYLPRKGEMVQPHDPNWFYKMILHYQGNPASCQL
ncbi:MAG: homoserine kinase [Betaproteobacteria bacterium]|nr:homoserine kinase [Betaproteobacteria bacterium]MDE2056289.1 homoserine kinase [Betaproteobacteria bacterium]